MLLSGSPTARPFCYPFGKLRGGSEQPLAPDLIRGKDLLLLPIHRPTGGFLSSVVPQGDITLCVSTIYPLCAALSEGSEDAVETLPCEAPEAASTSNRM